MIKSLKIFLFTVFFTFSNSYAQEIPPINKYTPEIYGAENQNWAISQNSKKYIYVANNKGLLEFNGASWQLYATPNETIMRSVKCHEDLVYTGFYMDFGFWQKDDFGQLKYSSIVKQNNITMLEDEQIWEICELDGWVIFKSLERIYLYNIESKDFKIINATDSILKISRVENRIYFQELGKGVFVIENGQPKLISDHEILKESRVVEILNKNGTLFFVTQKDGFFYLENKLLEKWTPSSTDLLATKTIYSAKQLKNGNLILGTISSGIIKINQTGDVIYHITQDVGLSNNTVLSIFEDLENNIWLGLDNGINTINLKSPFKQFLKNENFWGTIYASIIYEDYLYIGTNQGLYYKRNNSVDPFMLIENTEGQVWSLQVFNDTLFCNHDSGTFTISNNRANIIEGTFGSWQLKQVNKSTLILGNYEGLYVIKSLNGIWQLKNKIEGFANSSRYFEIINKDKIFVNHEYKGVFKLDVDGKLEKIIKIVKDKSVEKGIHSSLINYNNNILYSCKKGIYKYDEKKDTFLRDSVYSQLMPEEKFLSAKLINDKANNKLWSFTKDDIRYLIPGKFSNQPDLEVISIKGSLFKGASGYENLLNLKDEIYLVGTTEGYLVIDLNLVKEPADFYINIDKVLNNEIDDSQEYVKLNNNQVFDKRKNSFQFFYSVPNYSKSSSVKYQYKLEGLNSKWSSLSLSNNFLFKNLDAGDYTFKVRASLDGKLSENVASYSFEILKPWYFSNTLILIYIILFLVFLYILHLFSRRYYKKQREELIEKSRIELELKELESSQKIIKLNNDKLRSNIESKNRELATSTMSIIKKNEFLNTIKQELTSNGNSGIPKVIKFIDKNLNNTDDWKMFQEAFNNADKKFLKKIKAKHPELTPNDLRLCAYLRLNLSSKEIAPLLNISPRSVEVKRYRLRKKINLPHDANLTNYILEI
ncbi:helix-turn-helix and ligand-binding sensor domain-containing protein [Polaribacter dokdonensis]|uniref:Regulatory protein, luxR family n=1 Tax=Polaribacter dokdonensis DSW-5 TaxID=1300348 RepID=A0A0M9CH33_9FLAO|nr:triple tyrosine motif-containing protein [Polaribacter dokdonensis]KOY52286.1 Two component regulator three Y domain-containing protein [Polaribacter dokdonensis DSW-5]SEE42622.1 regulatory protein, luxR family [Polaribacter dokdonensis DSW-5]